LAETIALVGSESLLGKEIREVFGETALGQDLRLVAAAGEEPGKLAEVGDSIAFLTKMEPDAVVDSAIVILAGPPETSRQVLDLKLTGTVIDLTYITEDDPEARVRAPYVESDLESDKGGGALNGPQVIAHPAAIAIAMVLLRLHENHPVRKAIIHVFEPASERGKAGVDELQEQTMSLLTFQQIPKKVFDAQVSFSMLAQFGEEAPVRLADVEERIERHLATLLERSVGDGLGSIPMPSIRLVQAPVFHGYTFSWWIDFEDDTSVEEIENALHGEFIEVRTSDTEAPNNIAVAGQSGVSVGAVQPDRNSGNAFWLWMAADNLRLSAEAAAAVAREIL